MFSPEARSPTHAMSSSERLLQGLSIVDGDKKIRKRRRRRSYFAAAVCCIVVLIIVLLLIWLIFLRQSSRDPEDEFDPWPPRLVVQTTDSSDEAIAVLAAPIVAALMRHTKLGASGLEILEFDGMDTLRVVARRLAADLGPGLKFMAQDYTVETDSKVTPLHVESLAGLAEQTKSPSRNLKQVQDIGLQWHLDGSACTWNHTRGEGVIIAVMDTGCDLKHPDLFGNAWTNQREIPDNGIDDDGNGFVDDVMGWNFGSQTSDVSDSDGHGTHVAAIVAGSGSSMVSGVAPGAKVMCLKVQDDDGHLFASYIFAAYQYAMDMGAHIIVNSFSNTYWSVPQNPPEAKQFSRTAAYEDAARALEGAGILIFAAAGNEQVSNDALEVSGYPNLPTNLQMEHVVSVAATDRDLSRWSDGHPNPASQVPGSNFGAHSVDIGAPGVNIVSAQASARAGKGLEGRTGTSMATPFAAGFAALLLSHLARDDYKLFGRGLEVKAALSSVSSLSGPLASSGIVYWGQGTTPNAVLDWAQACQYVGGQQHEPPEFSLTGQSEERPQFDDVESYLPRSAGSARTSTMLVEFFRSAVNNPPPYYVSDLAPQPDYSRAVSRGIDFGPAIGGLEGVLDNNDENYNKFRRDFTVRVEGVMELPPGNTSLRLSCPGNGGLFLGKDLVHSSPAEVNSMGHVLQLEETTELEVTAVCIFKDPKTYMQLQSALFDQGGNSTAVEFLPVDRARLSRRIDVKEYGNERIFMSHAKGLGSSAELSSINAAGFGVLLKAYNPVEALDTTSIDWTDTQVTFMQLLDNGFPGHGDGTGSTWGELSAPVLAEFSGIVIFPGRGTYTLALSCDGWCNLSLYGSLLAESKVSEGFDEPAQCIITVDKAGPFPYRILYYQRSGKLGMSLRWSRSSNAFEPVPANHLFTDAHMEYASSGKLLTGSIAGLRLDFWKTGESIGASKPLITKRLEPGFNMTFTLQDLFPSISLQTEYAMQIHGYMALPDGTRTLQPVHAAGQATVHIGHCLFQISDASGSGPATLSRGTNNVLPSLVHDRLFHIQITLTRVRATEEVRVSVGRLGSDGQVDSQPLTINEGARADIRLRSETHDPSLIGDPGGLWMLYEPRENEFNSSIANALDNSARFSWAASVHTADAGVSLDHPLQFALPPGTDTIIRFTSFYHAKGSGVHGLGLYCYAGDSIHVTLAGVTLVQSEECQPKVYNGVVFNIIPIYLAEGYYTFEYSIRTNHSLAYLMAEVLPHSVAAQPQGLISAASQSLYLPASLAPVIGDTARYAGKISTNETIAVVHL